MVYRPDVRQSINEITASEWDALGGGRPFYRHAWFQFLEAAFPGEACAYIRLFEGETCVAAAVGFRRRAYYIPYVQHPLAKRAMQQLLRRCPLFSCENPLTETSGLAFLPGYADAATAQALLDTLRDAAVAHGAFFLGLDYLDADESALIKATASDGVIIEMMPDTYLPIQAPTWEAFVADLPYRQRKDVRRELRRAEAAGYRVESWEHFAVRSEELYSLVANVHRQHGEPAVPVRKDVYAAAERFVPGSVALVVRREERIVACGLILRDDDLLLPTLAGLEYSEAAVAYPLLAYGAVRHAIESGGRGILFGTTSYEIKQRLGCQLQPRAYAFSTRSRFLNVLLRWVLGR